MLRGVQVRMSKELGRDVHRESSSDSLRGENSPEIVWGVAERGTRVVYDPGPVDRQLQ